MRLLPLLPVLLLGCASSSFAVNSDSPGGADTGVSTDTGAAAVEDGNSGTADGDVPGAEGGVVDGSDVVEAAPPCPMTALPPFACTGVSYEPHHDVAGSEFVGPPVAHNVKHVVSFVLAKSGRIQKIGFRMRRNDLGSGTDGTFTVSAYYVPCPDVMVPIGKPHVKAAGEVLGETTFYFNPDVTSGTVFLPWMQKGARIAFVVETTSTRYTWDLRGAAPSTATDGLRFLAGSKTGSAAWVPSVARFPATMTYINACE